MRAGTIQFKGMAATSGHGRQYSWRRAMLAGSSALALAVVASSESSHAQVAPDQLPTGATVIAGSDIMADEKLTILPRAQRGAITWDTFDIGEDAEVTFQQGPTNFSYSRVTGADPSQILGILAANGTAIVVNTNGIVTGENGRSNGNLLLSTLAIDENDFVAVDGDGNYLSNAFAMSSGSTMAAVVNHGNAVYGADDVTLAGGHVHNSGQVKTGRGTISLIGAETATLRLDPAGRFDVTADGGVSSLIGGASAVVENTGYLEARGGTVYVVGKANAAETSIVGIHHSGSINVVDPVLGFDGTAILRAVGSSLISSGSIDAGGGHVELSADGSVTISGNVSTGRLNLIARTGLLQTGGAILATGTTVVDAQSSDISLNSASNDFGGPVSLTGGTVSIHDANALTLGTVSASSLTVVSQGALNLGSGTPGVVDATSAGPITQSGTLVIGGSGKLSKLNAGSHAITLLGAGNEIYGSLDVTGGDVKLHSSKGLGFNQIAVGSLTASSAISMFLGSGTVDGDLNVSTPGSIWQGGALVVGGTSTISSSTFGVTLDNAGNDFQGTVNLTGDTVSIRDVNALTLGTVSARRLTVVSAGALNLGSGTLGAVNATSGGPITQSGALMSGGASKLNAGSHAITLQHGGNEIYGPLDVTGGDVQLHSSMALGLNQISVGSLIATSGLDMFLGSGTVDGDLVVATSRAIRQGGALLVGGTSSIGTSNYSVTLDDAGNDFQGTVSLGGGAVSIRDANALTLGTVSADSLVAASTGALGLGHGTITGTLTATSNGGAITQSGALAVGGTSTLDADGGGIALSNADNDFGGAVSLTGGAVSIGDANALTLGTVSTGSLVAASTGALGLGHGTITGTLAATSNGGAISQGGALQVVGTSTLDAGSGTIILDNANNDFQGTVTLTGGAVSIRDANALTLGAVTAGSLTVDSDLDLHLSTGAITNGLSLHSDNGAITQSGALTVGGASALRANSIVLDNAGNDFAGALEVAGRSISVVDVNDLTISGVDHSRDYAISLVAGGTLTLAAQPLEIGASALRLASNGGTLATSGELSAAIISLTGRDGLTLGHDVTAIGDLTLDTVNASVVQTGGAISAGGALEVNAGSGSISLTQSANDFRGSVHLVGGAVSVRDVDDLAIASLSYGANQDVSLIAGGTLTLTSGDIDTGTGQLTLASNGGALATSGELSAAIISLTGRNGLTLGHDVTAAGSLTLAGANAAIVQTGGTLSAGRLEILTADSATFANASNTVATLGDVTVAGAFRLNNSIALTVDGTLSADTVAFDIGQGVTVETGSILSARQTAMHQGHLRVNGEIQGAVQIEAAASLGGSGTVGSTVIRSGGALNPGNSIGTLTVAGDLTLESGSVLNYELGRAGTSASPAAGASDRITVANDLTLNGTLNVVQSGDPADGTADLGYYRLFTYGGALDGAGLTLGATPSGIDNLGGFKILTGGGNVDLFIAALGSGMLQHWQGGDGTWGATQTQWINADGDVAVAWAGHNAVFKHNAGFTGGVVTVEGSQSFKSLQFVDAGYELAGAGTLHTHADGSEIRVLADRATISAAISGTGGITKTEAGTLVLTGANSYTGGTVVQSGVLRAGSGDAFVQNSSYTVNGGALDLNGHDLAMASLAGTGGTVALGGASLTLAPAADTTYAGSLTGTGSFIKQGGSTLVLTGDSHGFAGSTSVVSGTLVVGVAGDGSLGGSVMVGAGGRLSGSGSIGGDVTVQGGGTLTPGNSPGTLTIGGDLALASDATLAFELGEANAVGGALNDHIVVGGDLVLDGTLDVAVSAGGTFGAGVYRLISYSGTLTDNGLTLGTMPVDAGIALQTAISGQVNLINLDGLAFSYWDGTSATPHNGVIEGGSGIWRAGASTAWTNASGLLNGGYEDEAFAVFSGRGGTVTLDAGQGAIRASGLQFLSDGYVLEGDALVLTGADATIRVGDGTSAGSGMTATIHSALTGAARLVKADFGTLVLTGANSFTGGTVVEGGTLRAGSRNAFVRNGSYTVNGGTLDLNGHDLAMASLSGTGGTVALGGANLTIAQAADTTYAGSLTGAGGITKQGSGILLLTGANSYTGGTVVESGVLRAGSGNAFVQNGSYTVNGGTLDLNGHDLTMASLSGTGGTVALGDASLTLAQTGDTTYAGKLTGTGSFTKKGGGTLVFTTDNSGFAGMVRIAEGHVIVGRDGSGTLGGTVRLETGTRLSGSGTVGSTIVGSGSTLAPGNSIGTLTVNGDLTLTSGSVYEVEVDPVGTASDRVHVTGMARLEGGAVMHIGENGDYRPFARYTILSAEGGVEGKFGSVQSSFAFLTPTLSYTDRDVSLELSRNTVRFTEAAATANQRGVAAAAERLGAGHAVYDAVVALPDDAARVRSSFDLLSGEVHASARSALIEDSRFVREAVSQQLQGGTGGGLWGQTFGGWARRSGNDNAARLTHSAKGILLGWDIALGEGSAGVLAGYGNTDVTVSQRASTGDAESYHLGLYWGTRLNSISLRGGAAYSWHDLETRRDVSAGTLSQNLRADYKANSMQAFAEAAWAVHLGRAVLEPFVGLAHVVNVADDFRETGGTAALSSRADDLAVTFATLGLNARLGFNLGRLPATVLGSLGWQHALGDVKPNARHAFANGDVFAVEGSPLARDAARLKTGLQLMVSERASLGLGYNGQYAAGVEKHDLSARFAIRF